MHSRHHHTHDTWSWSGVSCHGSVASLSAEAGWARVCVLHLRCNGWDRQACRRGVAQGMVCTVTGRRCMVFYLAWTSAQVVHAIKRQAAALQPALLYDGDAVLPRCGVCPLQGAVLLSTFNSNGFYSTPPRIQYHFSNMTPPHIALARVHHITQQFRQQGAASINPSRPRSTRLSTTIYATAAPASLHRMDSTSTGRHFDNTLADWVQGSTVEIPQETLQRLVTETVEQVVRARHANDPFAYVGSTGVAYMLWHIATAGGPPQASHLPTASGIIPTNNWLERGLRYTRAAVQDVQRYSREQYGVSLLCGR